MELSSNETTPKYQIAEIRTKRSYWALPSPPLHWYIKQLESARPLALQPMKSMKHLSKIFGFHFALEFSNTSVSYNSSSNHLAHCTISINTVQGETVSHDCEVIISDLYRVFVNQSKSKSTNYFWTIYTPQIFTILPIECYLSCSSFLVQK